MAKRSQKRVLGYNKDQMGCIWTFFSIFDFRNVRSTRHILSDKTRHHSERQQLVTGNGDFETKLKMMTNSFGELQSIQNQEENESSNVKVSVKELMEKEMFIEEDQNKMNSDQVNGKSDKRSRRTSSWSSFSSKSSNYHDEKLPNDSLDLDEAINEICHQIHQERFIKDLDTNYDDFDKAIKAFVTDQIIHGRNPRRRRRSRSLEEILLNEDEKRSTVATQFSFTEIKRRLKHAMIQKSWPSMNARNYNEKYAMPLKRKGENEKLKEEMINEIYIKAKKHLSEIIMRSGDENEHCSSSRRSLERIISETIEKKKKSLSSFDDLIDSVSTDQNLENHKDDMEIVITTGEEEHEVLDSSETPCLLEADHESCCQMGSSKLKEDELLLLPSSLSSSSSSPSSSPVNKKSYYTESSNERSSEGPSPISVLEPTFEDDTIKSPSNHLSSPRKIQFEELDNHEISTRTNQDDEESLFEYVEAVLLASDLKWEEFLQRWISSIPILNPSLFHEVELFSSRSLHDQKLLFDCTNEVLEEVCRRYFSYCPRVSFIKHDIRPAPVGKDLIEEIWEGVEWNLLQISPCVLEYTIEKDMMERFENRWMNLREETEGIGAEICDDILEELLVDLIGTLVKRL